MSKRFDKQMKLIIILHEELLCKGFMEGPFYNPIPSLQYKCAAFFIDIHLGKDIFIAIFDENGMYSYSKIIKYNEDKSINKVLDYIDEVLGAQHV